MPAPYSVEAPGAGPRLVYIGPKGAFHLGGAVTVDGADSRGIFKTVSPCRVRYWSNSFRRIHTPDPHYWHYRMVGYDYDVAFAKHASCWCGYKVYVRNTAHGTGWHFYQYAKRGRPQGNSR